ncbi:hypothetical protein Tco_0297960, partial [Tanacetum coccineum]
LYFINKEEHEAAKKAAPSKKPSRKQPAGVVIRDTSNVYVPKKKTPARADKNKGIDLLSNVATLEVAQIKKVIKRSKLETNIHQAGRSSDKDASSENEHESCLKILRFSHCVLSQVHCVLCPAVCL